jgi:cytosine/adenosine deaminase-related metal-dependent hydrolase
MEGRLVLKNCSVFRLDGGCRSGMAVLIEGERISSVSPDADVPVLPGDWEVACGGRLVAPGLVDCHAHLVGGQLFPYSGRLLLASPRERFEAQQQIESELAPSEVEPLTYFAIARALRFGVTFVVEHLHCPADVAGGLEVQARAAERLGARFVNSHATHSRCGQPSAVRQLEANAAQAKARKANTRVRCALGFHASFACEEDLLSRLSQLSRELDVGVHGHLAESADDLATTLSHFGERIVRRLDRHGLLGPGFIGAHACAVEGAECQLLATRGAVVALSALPRLTEGLSCEGWEGLGTQRGLFALGTAGSISLSDAAMAAFSKAVQDARLGRGPDPDQLLASLLWSTPARLSSRIFGERCGAVEAGNLADLVVYNLVPPDSDAAVAPHLGLEMMGSSIAWTIVAGRVVVREGCLLAHDYVELAREAERARQAVWRRTGADQFSPSSSVARSPP